MFSRKSDLIRKTGEDGIDRLNYLESLHREFTATNSYEYRKQVLANLANFAYDPVNYEYFRRLGIITLFVEVISSSVDETLIYFAISGLCNLCLDPENKETIIRLDGPKYITPLLTSTHTETVLNSMTTLLYIITPETKASILTPIVRSHLQNLSTSSNIRIENLSTLFLKDYFRYAYSNPTND